MNLPSREGLEPEWTPGELLKQLMSIIRESGRLVVVSLKCLNMIIIIHTPLRDSVEAGHILCPVYGPVGT
jgi:hypothetical protein